MNRRTSQRGFSLIEALVALVVMGFGMLGVLGIQAALRQYSDISKQRSEAVRLAQGSTEAWRAFVQLDADVVAVDYAEILTDSGVVTGTLADATNTTYSLARNVAALPSSVDRPQRGKWLETILSWNDRTGAGQEVRFHTHISGVAPDLAGTLVVPPAGGANAVRRPLGRHAGIPRQAIDNGDGTSSFPLPESPTTIWHFNNLTGAITKICAPACSDFLGFLLSGFVRAADPTSGGVPIQPTGVHAVLPAVPSATFGSFGVSVDQTVPAAVTGTVVCAIDSIADPSYVAYYCAIPVTLAETRWSGRSYLTGLASLAADATITSSANARVCRYTPTDSHTAANVDHPLDYGVAPDYVTSTLFNQNFLIIRAGDGSAAFTCTNDDDATPINGNTHIHQPIP